MSGFSREAASALKNTWVRDRCAEGTLTFPQLAEVTYGGSAALRNPMIQDFLGQEENRQCIGQVSGFSRQAALALENGWVRGRLAGGTLTFQQLVNATDAGSETLSNRTIQDFLEQEENWQHIGQVIGFSPQQAKALQNAQVRTWLTDKSVTFQQLVDEADELFKLTGE